MDTGLVRFGARDYDPDLARWTAKDPSGFAGGDTNLYAYAYGDPVNFVDPDGELAFLVPLAVMALKGALIGAATDAGLELASQLIDNGGNIDCLDWGDIGASGFNGGLSGGLTGPLGKALSSVRKIGRAGKGRSTLRPGPYAKESIPGHRGKPTADEQRQMTARRDHARRARATTAPGSGHRAGRPPGDPWKRDGARHHRCDALATKRCSTGQHIGHGPAPDCFFGTP